MLQVVVYHNLARLVGFVFLMLDTLLLFFSFLLVNIEFMDIWDKII